MHFQVPSATSNLVAHQGILDCKLGMNNEHCKIRFMIFLREWKELSNINLTDLDKINAQWTTKNVYLVARMYVALHAMAMLPIVLSGLSSPLNI